MRGKPRKMSQLPPALAQGFIPEPGAHPDHIHGTQDPEQTLQTMRMAMRRLTQLTNAFSKKVDNLQHAVSLYFMY
jgi:hypothetical protein